MRVIHTWKNTDNTLPKTVAYGQMLSALLAKKHYGNVHLYTTERLAKIVREMGVPYDSINTTLLENDEPIDCFSIPKIKVFQDQTEEFLHIDLDTYIYDKIDFTQYESPAVFSHPDFGVRDIHMPFDFIASGLLNKYRHPVIDWQEEEKDCDSVFSYIMAFYIGPFIKFIDSHPLDLIKHINFSSIPNMNIVHIKQQGIEDFRNSCKEALSHYYKHKEEIDKLRWGACYVEQFYLHAMMMALNKEYRHACTGYEQPKNCVFPILPFRDVDTVDQALQSAEILTKVDNDYVRIKKTFKTEKDRKEFFSSDMYGFYHSTWATHTPYIQSHIIYKIVELFDEKYALGVNRHFNTPIPSRGEQKYMELFENNLFE